MARPFKDLTGMRFGKLVVKCIGQPYISPKGSKKIMWLCICDCGNIANVASSPLLSGRTGQCQSCGLKKQNISIGDRYGRLTVLDHKPGKCICLCDCGRTIDVARSSLISKNTTQCRLCADKQAALKRQRRNTCVCEYCGKKYEKCISRSNTTRFCSQACKDSSQRGTVIDNYFDEWSYKSAYIFGFILADGCLTKNAIQISLAIKDLSLLEEIRDELCPDYKIANRPKQLMKGEKGYVQSEQVILRFSSQHMIKTLNNFGLESNKTYSSLFPSCVPEKFKSAYLCGIFDGDGCLICKPRTLYGQNSGGFTRRWQITGYHYDFFQQLKDYFKIDGKIQVCTNNGRIWHNLILNRYDNILSTCEFMYKDKDKHPFLQRKFDIFQEIKNQYEKKSCLLV